MKKIKVFPMVLAAVFFLAAISLFADGDIGSGVVGLALSALFVYLSIKKGTHKGFAATSSAADIPTEVNPEPRADTVGVKLVAVAGVTYNNEDGSSRQKILKNIVKNEDGTAYGSLEQYDYKGSPAIRVVTDEGCIGNIRKNDVEDVLAVMEKIKYVTVNAESFENDDGKTVYRADVVIGYFKD